MGQEIAITNRGQRSVALSMPREIASALENNSDPKCPDGGTYHFARWDAEIARRSLDAQGYLDRVPDLLNAIVTSLEPVDPDWLNDRLSMLWLSMSVSADEDRATAWLHETARLLSDVPQDILADAIDKAVLASERGFIPSVGAIRAIAVPALERRRERHTRLWLINLPPKERPTRREPEKSDWTPVTPEEAAEIKARFGLGPSNIERPDVGRDYSNLRRPTVEDYVALGLSREDAALAVSEVNRGVGEKAA